MTIKEGKKQANYHLADKARQLLCKLAKRENRSYTNMVETLIYREAERQNLQA